MEYHGAAKNTLRNMLCHGHGVFINFRRSVRADQVFEDWTALTFTDAAGPARPHQILARGCIFLSGKPEAMGIF